MNTKKLFAISALCTSLAMSGCAMVERDALKSYKSAQQELQTLKAHPQVAANAPVALYDAEKYLQQAEEARKGGDDPGVWHFTYMAQRQLDIAKAMSEGKEADKHYEALVQEHGDIVAQGKTGQIQQQLSERDRRIQQLESELSAFETKRDSRGLVVTLDDVLFATGKAELQPGSMRTLDRLVQVLQTHPNQKLVIEGHTDSVGSAEKNRDLSERRAEAVRRYLSSQGIPAGQIVARGLGESFPVASNNNAAGRQQNRRVEVVIQNTTTANQAANEAAPASGSDASATGTTDASSTSGSAGTTSTDSTTETGTTDAAGSTTGGSAGSSTEASH